MTCDNSVMPRTPEQRARNAEYQRAYRLQNPDKFREWWQASRTPENREARRQYQRSYYVANREKVAERQKDYQDQNRDRLHRRQRAYRERHPERDRERHRVYRDANQEQARVTQLRRRHGMRPEDWSALWEAQAGRCYLCGGGLAAEKAHIDHDHSCCGPDRSCETCRRGLACEQCNRAIGLARDDPDRLRRMADALEAAKRGVAARMAEHRPVEQLTLL
jgi:Recombination endonuclease VII